MDCHPQKPYFGGNMKIFEKRVRFSFHADLARRRKQRIRGEVLLEGLQWQTRDLRQGGLWPEHVPFTSALHCLQISAGKLHRRRTSEGGPGVDDGRSMDSSKLSEQLSSDFRVLLNLSLFPLFWVLLGDIFLSF